MKTLIMTASLAIILSGCSIFYDAPRIDADHGQAQTQAWDNQIVFVDYRYAGATAEGLGGIPSEQIMKVYNQSFGEKPTKQTVLNLGISGGGSK